MPSGTTDIGGPENVTSKVDASGSSQDHKSATMDLPPTNTAEPETINPELHPVNVIKDNEPENRKSLSLEHFLSDSDKYGSKKGEETLPAPTDSFPGRDEEKSHVENNDFIKKVTEDGSSSEEGDSIQKTNMMEITEKHTASHGESMTSDGKEGEQHKLMEITDHREEIDSSASKADHIEQPVVTMKKEDEEIITDKERERIIAENSELNEKSDHSSDNTVDSPPSPRKVNGNLFEVIEEKSDKIFSSEEEKKAAEENRKDEKPKHVLSDEHNTIVQTEVDSFQIQESVKHSSGQKGEMERTDVEHISVTEIENHDEKSTVLSQMDRTEHTDIREEMHESIHKTSGELDKLESEKNKEKQSSSSFLSTGSSSSSSEFEGKNDKGKNTKDECGDGVVEKEESEDIIEEIKTFKMEKVEEENVHLSDNDAPLKDKENNDYGNKSSDENEEKPKEIEKEFSRGLLLDERNESVFETDRDSLSDKQIEEALKREKTENDEKSDRSEGYLMRDTRKNLMRRMSRNWTEMENLYLMMIRV